MMMGFGFLFILLVVAILVIGTISLVAWLVSSRRRGNPLSVMPQAEKHDLASGPASGSDGNRFCSHCGAGLHAGWTHCPQCGAPVT